MLTKEMIDKFYSDLEALGLKNPVTSIHKATGFNKGTVSMYLNRKDEPSENFIKAFYNKFGESLGNANHRPQEAQHAPDYRDEIISLLKERSNSEARKTLQYLQVNNALLKTVVQALAKIQASLDKRKLKDVQIEMNNLVEQHLEALRKEGT